VKLGLVFLSLFIGYLQYKYVEEKFRTSKSASRAVDLKLFLASTIGLLLVPVMFTSHPLYSNNNTFAEERKPNNGLSAKCETFKSNGEVWPECKNNDIPNIAVWGDSFAMHLIPGLIQHNNIVQITKPACSPFKGISIHQGSFDKAWGLSCLQFTEDALKYITNNKSIEYVVLSAPIVNLVKDKGKVYTENGLVDPNINLLVNSIIKTVSILELSGKSVIFFSPPPRDNRNIGECLERLYGPSVTFVENCDMDKFNSDQYLANAINVLDLIKDKVKIFDVRALMCDDIICKTEVDGMFLIRDRAHISIKGSKHLFRDVKIEELFKKV
jgi:hypothetical protein